MSSTSTASDGKAGEKNLENEAPIAEGASNATGQAALAVYGDEPTFDAGGYPTYETEATIMDWPFEQGYHSLMAYIARAWKYPDYFRNEGEYYRISTGGWSGNESLMWALEKNRVFWALCWESSTIGGHYVFTVPVPSDAEATKSDAVTGASAEGESSVLARNDNQPASMGEQEKDLGEH